LGASTSLDWRDYNAVTSVKDQGSCGCCWSFATAAYAESKLILENSQYTISNINLSEQYLLKCTKYGTCQGGYLEYAFQQGLKMPTEEDYPYSPYTTNSNICSASGITIATNSQSYYSLSDSDLISLLQSGPVAIAISSSGWQNYGSGVYSCPLVSAVDHAVLLIGYTPTYWIVKNQWGTSWGEGGYIRISRNPSSNCQIGTAAHIMFNAALPTPLILAFLIVILLLF